MRKILRSLLMAAICTIPFQASFAQFYNGHQMNFGKNRVQYSQNEWRYYRYPKFDTYYNYQQEKDIAQYTCDRALEIIPEMEKFFGRTIQRRIIFVVYSRLAEFRQSNIGLVSDESQSNLGGVTRIIGNKVMLYFDGDHNKYDTQIREAVASIVLSGSVNNGLRNRVQSSASESMPEWYSSGLSYFAAESWNAEIEDILKDGFESGKYKKINYLSGDDAKYAGYSLWYFINRTYGRDAIPGIIYLTGISKSPNLAIRQVLNVKFKQLNDDWNSYYLEKFGIEGRCKNVSESDDNDLLSHYKRNTVYDKPLLSPDGRRTFYCTNKYGKYKVYITDNETNTTTRIFTEGHKLEQITEYNYPVAVWHKSSRVVCFAIEHNGYPCLCQYNVETGEITRRVTGKFDKIFSMSYSDDGLNLVMSVQISGCTDIVVYNIASGSFDVVTKDLADDIDPQFIENSSKIIFASNRIKDTLRYEKIDNHDPIGKTYDIFVYDYKRKSNVLKRITSTKYENETSPSELAVNSYSYLSDRNGIVNRYASVYDSSIIAIDTAVHYSYTNRYKPMSNMNHNILYLDVNKQQDKLTMSYRSKGRYRMKTEPLSSSQNDLPEVLSPTYFREINDRRQARIDSMDVVKKRKAQIERQRIDSIVANPPKNLQHPDSMKYDITNYYFEEEKSLAHQLIFYNQDLKARHVKEAMARPTQKIYYTTFYTDYLVSQLDFSSLSQCYQPFAGGSPYYFSPGANAFFKIGLKDLFEDYRISAAFRIGGNFDSYEYYFTLEDLKKRLDKQYVFHRYSYTDDNNSDYSLTKVVTNEAMYIATYPFNQAAAVRGTLGLRFDKTSTLVTDYPYLNQDPKYQVFANAKAEYIFDNTRQLTTNIPEGVRLKGWTELYQQVEGNYDIISSWGFDARYYQRLHRCMIFAARAAAATSFGSGKILYYLGGVDNWTTFSSDIGKRFDQSVRIDQQENYIYQAVGTNMRGFIQNCRNGNTFAVVNTEIRLPLFRYLANRPISSKFINDFQIIGFFDAGSAWSGFKPNANNAYNKYELTNGSITMIIDVTRPSIVAGYGFGLRTSLLGYFLRFDWAWGIEGHVVLPRTFYFSLGFDF
jgi:hypothetical protein